MSYLVGVITENDYLFQKIYLCLGDSADVVRLSEPKANHLLIFDLDTEHTAPPHGAITVGHADNCSLRIPFDEAELLDVLNDKKSSTPLVIGQRCAILRGERIHLTELECSLLSRLLADRGKSVTREQLLADVWHGDADSGIVNVYIHYLREKLERNGEKIILSSRSAGYRISEKYVREEE